MKRNWSDPELDEVWLLSAPELQLLKHKIASNRLTFALQLKHLNSENRFFEAPSEIAPSVLAFVARQLAVHPKLLAGYDPESRTAKRDRTEIRKYLGWRQATDADHAAMAEWLEAEVLPDAPDAKRLDDIALSWYRERKIEISAAINRDRFIRAAVNSFETEFFESCASKLTKHARASIDDLLNTSIGGEDTDSPSDPSDNVSLRTLKADPRRPGVDSIQQEIAKLRRVDQLKLPTDLFENVSGKLLETLRRRVATEPASELKLRVEPVRYTMIAAYCWQRRREVIDGLVDLLIQTVHKIGVSAEHKVERQLLDDFRRVRGKATVLFKIAEAAVEPPRDLRRLQLLRRWSHEQV